MHHFRWQIVFLLILVLAPPSLAQQDQDWSNCNIRDPDTPRDIEIKIAGCTRVIGRKDQSSRSRAIAYANRGLAYQNRPDRDRAIADFSQSIRLDPEFPNWHYARGTQYGLRGDLDRAIVDFTSAIRIKSDVAGYHDQRAIALRLKNERRIALVVGNSAYVNTSKLRNPRNDAQALGGALKKSGFAKVTVNLDLTRTQLLETLKAFAADATNADWALVYYAGHGIELGGANFLVPTDAKLQSDQTALGELIELDDVLQGVAGARRLGVVIIDACRNNPLAGTMRRTMNSTQGFSRGLAPMQPLGATFVAYAAKHGQEALDGAGVNSPFAASLVKQLETPSIEITLLFRKVRDDVMAATDRKQEPFTYASLPAEEFVFKRP